jgi:uncharacterized protein involved in exopolysaccharide biosynthesis
VAARTLRLLPKALWCALLVSVIVAAVVLLLPRHYTSSSAFVPQSRRGSQSGVSGLAAQLGVMIPGADASQGPAFYVDLATSRNLLGRLVQDTLPLSDGPTTLVDWYGVGGATDGARREVAIDRLRHDLMATVATKTGVVHVDVTMRSAALAALVNAHLLELLNEFNLHTRQSQAGSERRFTERRMTEVRTDLREAENRLASFLKVNRDYQNAPDLRFQFDRLSREVSIQQQLFVSLAQAFEQAKIDEVRDTPVISVVESPEVPARPDARFLALKICIAFIGAAVLALLTLLALDFMEDAKAREPAEYAEFERVRSGVAASLRSGIARVLRSR